MALLRPRLLFSAALLVGTIGLTALVAVPRPPVQGVVVTAAATGRETSAESVAAFQPGDLMPVDPDVTVGTLPNGLRYYVRQNPRPLRRAELRLVVRAGSVLEDPDQLGLAHFVEHLEFEGTEHFPKDGINGFLASLGIGIGPDANAATSYDETQYTLRVPTDLPGALDRALLLLEDWAHAASFDPEAIERQRAIVLSEWRQQLGAAERTRDRIRRVQLAGSRYAERAPIGDPDVIRQATREQLLRFYRDWYRPNLMAVIVVGDVDRAATVAMIERHFSGLTNPAPSRPRPAFDVPEQPGTRYAVISDREATGAAVAVSNLRPSRRQDTVGGYRQIMVDQLFGEMMTARLAELDEQARPPFLAAAAARSLFDTPRTKDEVLVQAVVPPDGVTRGLDALVTEMERIARFGFTDTELARAKQARLRSYERSVTESPDRESSSRADEYTRNFLQAEALPTIWQELAFQRRFVPGVTLQEVNALAAQWFPKDNRLVIVTAPEVSGVALPGEPELAATVAAATARAVTPYEDLGAGETLMPVPPDRGAIVRETERPEAGVLEWTLSNGATVVLRPTPLKADQILFRAAALGGTSLADDEAFPSARATPYVIPAGGVGRFSANMLAKMLYDKVAVAAPFVSEIDHGLSGGSTPQDLETLFQLIHLRFTAPRADPVAFSSVASQVRAALSNRTASPDAAFRQALDAALGGGHPRRRPETVDSVNRWDLGRSLAFYRARFGDASRFTFVFVGSFSPSQLRPYVETYLASLPATRVPETFRDVGAALPSGIVRRTVRQGIAPKSQVAIVFTGPFVHDDDHLLALRGMTLVLQSRLFDTLRQELGATYSIEATQRTQRLPRPEYSVRIEWTCDPERTDALVQRVLDEIRFVRDTRLSRDQMARLQVALLRDLEHDFQDNGYLLAQIARRYEEGEADRVGDVFTSPRRILQLSADAIAEAARTSLTLDRYVQVTLLPGDGRDDR